jgi:rfaE bifunctional protein kinase chain/domain
MDKQRLQEIVSRFKELHLAVVGDIILDSYEYGSIRRTNPEAPALVLTMSDEGPEYRLGGAANVANNVQALGAEVSLYGLTGKDSAGLELERLCCAKKIKTHTIREGATNLKRRIIAREFQQQVLRMDFGECTPREISAAGEEFLYQLIKQHHTDGIIISDYNKGVFAHTLGQRVIDLTNERRIISAADLKPANASKFLGATIVRPNLKEAREILENGRLSDESLASKLRERMQSKYVIITCGDEGIIAYGDGIYDKIPTKARHVRDVSGAGDTAMAALTLSLLSGANLIEASIIANYAAGIVVEKPGTSIATQQELITRINSYET